MSTGTDGEDFAAEVERLMGVTRALGRADLAVHTGVERVLIGGVIETRPVDRETARIRQTCAWLDVLMARSEDLDLQA